MSKTAFRKKKESRSGQKEALTVIFSGSSLPAFFLFRADEFRCAYEPGADSNLSGFRMLTGIRKNGRVRAPDAPDLSFVYR